MEPRTVSVIKDFKSWLVLSCNREKCFRYTILSLRVKIIISTSIILLLSSITQHCCRDISYISLIPILIEHILHLYQAINAFNRIPSAHYQINRVNTLCNYYLCFLLVLLSSFLKHLHFKQWKYLFIFAIITVIIIIINFHLLIYIIIYLISHPV